MHFSHHLGQFVCLHIVQLVRIFYMMQYFHKIYLNYKLCYIFKNTNQILTCNTRSHKIGLMEVGEELGRRGHQVTVVSPQRYKKVPPNVTDIVIQSEFEALSKRMTNDLLTNDDRPSTPFVEVIPICQE